MHARELAYLVRRSGPFHSSLTMTSIPFADSGQRIEPLWIGDAEVNHPLPIGLPK